eukprot:jgi/Pico_ML_1/55496/g1171.t1
MKTVGIPIKLLHEAEGHEVMVELKSGDLYRGKLVSAQDNWNCQLKQVVHTKKDGSVAHVDDVFVRGSKVRWMSVPDMLKTSPMFQIRSQT